MRPHLGHSVDPGGSPRSGHLCSQRLQVVLRRKSTTAVHLTETEIPVRGSIAYPQPVTRGELDLGALEDAGLLGTADLAGQSSLAMSDHHGG